MSVRCKCDECGTEYWGSVPIPLSEVRFGGPMSPPDCPECRKKWDIDEKKRINDRIYGDEKPEFHDLGAGGIVEAPDLVKKISVLTTDKLDPDLHITEPNGQNKKYLILSKEERAKGFVRPVYRGYIHLKCGGLTRMGNELCETYARNPAFYGATYCAICGTHFPLINEQGKRAFIWDETAKYENPRSPIPTGGLGVGE